MKLVIQRCSKAQVEVDKNIVGKINNGLVILVGFGEKDNEKCIDYMIDKVINLRIFDDNNKVMNRSLIDVKGSILSISQFTLYADCNKGRRPSYKDALTSDKASILYDLFNKKLKNKGIKVETGIFGSFMNVSLVNDGPVTIILERKGDNEEE